MPEKYAISFAGGGFYGMCYYFGCLEYIINNLHTYMPREILGASAGAWAATALCMRDNIDFVNLRLKFFEFMDSLTTPPFHNHIETWFDSMFQFEDNHIKEFCTNSLYISVTKFDLKNLKFGNIMMSNFQSHNQLKKTLMQSSNVPGIFGNQLRRLDGGFSNNQPMSKTLKTVRINPIYGLLGAEIVASKWFNPMHIFMPIPKTQRDSIFITGYKDCKNYFEPDI